MKRKPKSTPVLLLSLICAVGFGVWSAVLNSASIGKLDTAVISFVQSFEMPSITTISKGLAAIGSTKGVVALFVLVSLFLYFVLKHRGELLLFASVLAGTAIVNQVLKRIFVRERPQIHPIIAETGYSFPSGHAMTALALYGCLAYIIWRHLHTKTGRVLWIAFSIIMIVSIGLSRIYLGVHYPSDVIGSYMASFCLLLLAVWIHQWVKERQGAHGKSF